LDKYERGLGAANGWIRGAIDEIESFDDEAIIVFMGDHGAFHSDHCTRNNPSARSRDVVIDNLGVLLAVKWPASYDGRYDDRIHSPMDLSWYFLQYLSGDAMDEEDKPVSASYLHNPTEKRVYEVVRDGEIVAEPESVKWSAAGKHWLREETP
jgi:arylsulfatase A-like enzyme